MKARFAIRAATAAIAIAQLQPAHAAAAAEAIESGDTIIVTGERLASTAGTKTDTPITQVPQPITVVIDDVYLAQGAISISDTLRYVAGIQANPYGSDSRVDGGFIRGIDPVQFRDGMHDIYSYYASIRSDPYNFSRVEVVRGPASVLFGSGSIGGILNMVSKVPAFERSGEVAVRYGSFDRHEALADVTGPLTDALAARLVARVRDAGTQVDHVPDDRVMIAPSLRWQPSDVTSLTLIGLYQEDDGGSTAQFLPNVGTILPNVNGPLPRNLFVGKPGWDRYDGRLLEGTVMADHQFSDHIKLSVKARYVDSDLTYFTHYPNNYLNPDHPYIVLDPLTGQPALDANGARIPDPQQRTMGLYSDGSFARMEIFTTDNNLRFDFSTGEGIEHVLLIGVDYSWNRVRKTGGFAEEFIDIYDIDYDSLSDFGGGLQPGAAPYEDTVQRQLGFYIQNQIRLWDRASIVLGARHDNLRIRDNLFDSTSKHKATTLRAGLIVEAVKGVSPFLSYTESFEPLVGNASNGRPFIPKTGRQIEAGVKFHPDDKTLATVTAFHIRESNRPVDDPSTVDPFDQRQAGKLTSKGFEVEASRLVPGGFEIIANYSYVWIREAGTGQQLADVAKHNASVWATQTFRLDEQTALRLGAGVRHTSDRHSGPITTPAYTLVDALAEITRGPWSFSVNANNLLGKHYFGNCLARGDCFNGADRNVFGTISYRF